MRFRRVLRADRGGDAALGPVARAFRQRHFGNQAHRLAGLGQAQCERHAGEAAAYDEDFESGLRHTASVGIRAPGSDREHSFHGQARAFGDRRVDLDLRLQVPE